MGWGVGKHNSKVFVLDHLMFLSRDPDFQRYVEEGKNNTKAHNLVKVI